ncbi:MAG: DUF3822 family protein [Tannerella sp.]|jgi:hypothetical protein|nr:DUF3822 family protein [Tannerella sp.]
MIIRVPNTLNVNNSEKYNVSIRLWPDGLSFSGYDPSEKDSFFTETISLDPNVPLVQALKDVFFENVCLSYVYNTLHVISLSGKYTLVPDSVFSEKEKDLLYSYCFQVDGKLKVLAQPLTGFYSFLLYGIEKEAYEFMVRSLVNPQFIHFLSPMLSDWRKKSMDCYPRQIYAVVHDGIVDIVCFRQGELLLINSFGYETENDIIYFIMYVCKQLPVSQLEDSVFFCGDKVVCGNIIPVIKKYIERVDFVAPKIRSYRVAVDLDLPIDIVTLVECGL